MVQLICKKLPNDVSRCGEYSFLKQHLRQSPPYVVDVGAYGKRGSNSWNLIKDDGWYGVLIEPQPERAAACLKEFEGVFKVVEAAVDTVAGTSTLYRFKSSGHASLLPTGYALNARAYRERVKTRRKPITVTTMPLGQLLEQLGVPERIGLLTVDTEGTDQRVIQSLFEDSPYRPDFLIAESADSNYLEAAEYTCLHKQPDQQIWSRLPAFAIVSETPSSKEK